jgi:predicted O-methyltransferase YrrM
LLKRDMRQVPERPLFVETGCGISTLYLADSGRALNAKIYSCDCNADKVAALRAKAGDRVANVEFLLGDSLENLERLCGEYPQFHFLFLDAAASAMHTWREFQIAEPNLKRGSTLLLDNSALPGETQLLSPCRKGRIIVPYLQAAANWELQGHPDAGDSMVSARYQDNAIYADPGYEWPEYDDPWEWSFANQWIDE